jgi:hypothetical protein
MPAFPEEIKQAKEEGVSIRFLTQPVEILGDSNGITGISCISMQLGEPDASGRRRPLPVPGSEFLLPAEGIIKAIGQRPDPLTIAIRGKTLAMSLRGTVEVHPVNLSTSIPGLFAGGDNVTGPATVVEAIWAGKQAARSIHRSLQGLPLEETSRIPTPKERIEAVSVSDQEMKTLKGLPCRRWRYPGESWIFARWSWDLTPPSARGRRSDACGVIWAIEGTPVRIKDVIIISYMII